MLRSVLGNKKKTLLLVDDDHSQLAARKTVLETSGYDLLAADDPRRGLQLFMSHPPDAVILDSDIPVVNGEVLARRMRHADCSFPILMLSGCVAPPESAFRAMDTFVAKNNPAPVLLTAIETLMHSRGLEAA